ncbi:hypothetical protein [Providencia sp. wls1914]|uniref:hypothetical protein n=1 Tax=Providencia sp. wls1914 TaxID=2675156 RepID=UPI0012B55B6F|nr:hypothetical protein [Providencia sp. wls1914]MTC70015.1 hypothetical protein [Providencia sp. wls1914]
MKTWMIGVIVALVFSISLIVGNQFDIEILTNIGVSMAWGLFIANFLISVLTLLVLFAFKFGDNNHRNVCREFISIFNVDMPRPRALFYLINNVFAIVFIFLSGFITTGVSLAVMGVLSRYLIKVAVRKMLCSTVTN